jgi:hypothetical protein
MLPSLFRHTSLVKELVCVKTLKTALLSLQSKILTLELSDIPVVHDILVVFLEVLPCFYMTVLSSS